MTFEERINPANFNFSPKFTAIVGGIIGYDYGARDGKGGKSGALSIASDGFVIAQSTAHESGAFIGTASDLERNVGKYVALLTEEDKTEFELRYAQAVTDWRR